MLECNLVKYIQVQTLVQVDWEPGPTEIVHKWAPQLLSPAPSLCMHILLAVSTLQLLRKEGNVLFNDALNTFYLRLYGVRHGKGPFR